MNFKGIKNEGNLLILIRLNWVVLLDGQNRINRTEKKNFFIYLKNKFGDARIIIIHQTVLSYVMS